MSPSVKNVSEHKKRPFNNGAFLGFTVAALSFAIIMIVLGQVSVSGSLPANHITTPPATTTVKPPTSTPVNTSPTTTVTTPVVSLPIASVSKGSPDAPVTIIEYSDFQCSNCQQFALTVEKQLETAYIDTGKVRLIYKFIIGWGEESLRADEAAACAAEQGKFWEYYYLLMEQRASSTADDLPVEKLQFLAQQLGLDMSKFNTSLLSGKYEAKVRQDDEEGRALGVTGTPAFFINGIKEDGAKTLQDLADIIDPILQNQGK